MLGHLYERALTGERCWVRLESAKAVGPWFRWASVGIESAGRLAKQVGLSVTGIHPVGERVVASLRAT